MSLHLGLWPPLSIHILKAISHQNHSWHGNPQTVGRPTNSLLASSPKIWCEEWVLCPRAVSQATLSGLDVNTVTYEGSVEWRFYAAILGRECPGTGGRTGRVGVEGSGVEKYTRSCSYPKSSTCVHDPFVAFGCENMQIEEPGLT